MSASVFRQFEFTEASLPDRHRKARGASVDKVLDIHRNGLCRNATFRGGKNLVQICHRRDTAAITGLYRA
jgi:hypothetical protein